MRHLPAVLALSVAVGCTTSLDTNLCSTAADCPNGACYNSPASGNQYCVINDPSCPPTNMRWAANAGDGLSGTCVQGSAQGRDMSISGPPPQCGSHCDFGTVKYPTPDMAVNPCLGAPTSCCTTSGRPNGKRHHCDPATGSMTCAPDPKCVDLCPAKPPTGCCAKGKRYGTCNPTTGTTPCNVVDTKC
jgi:hypothetical protein